MFAPPAKAPRAKTASPAPSAHTSKPLRQRPVQPGSGSAKQLFALQRTISNQAVLRLLATEQQNLYGGMPCQIRGQVRAPWRGFGSISIFPPERGSASQLLPPLPGVLQPKLEIGAADDPLEREANRVADRITRMPAFETGPAVAAAPRQTSRKRTTGQEQKKVQRQEVETGRSLGDAPAGVHEVLRSPGEALDMATRAYFEPRFGRDFGRVRVHSGVAAEQSAQAVNACAYTVGQNIVFGSSMFAPETQHGRRLLAHELAHVIQQSTTGASRVQRQAQGAAPSPHVWTIPKTGWYKGIDNNQYGGLPEILYPGTPNDFMSLTVIYMDVDQMARIQFDAQTILSESSGEPRLPHAPPEWASWFVQQRASPLSAGGLPALAAMEVEYKRLANDASSQISTINNPALKEFLSQRIHILLHPFNRAEKLHRTENYAGGIAPLDPFGGPDYSREDRLVRILL